MYTAQNTKNRIKLLFKSKKINDTKGMASFSLARIADYLDVSVDYLLGRTDNPNSHKS